MFCDTCSNYRRIVPWVDSDNAVRVCKSCENKSKLEPPPPVTIEHSREVAVSSRSQGQNNGNYSHTVLHRDPVSESKSSSTRIIDPRVLAESEGRQGVNVNLPLFVLQDYLFVFIDAFVNQLQFSMKIISNCISNSLDSFRINQR